MERVKGFVGVGSGLFAESFECELEGDGIDLYAILLDVELPDGTSESRRYIPERTAKKVNVPRQDHLRIGHLECSLCGTPIGYSNRFCHYCGAKLLEDES